MTIFYDMSYARFLDYLSNSDDHIGVTHHAGTRLKTTYLMLSPHQRLDFCQLCKHRAAFIYDRCNVSKARRLGVLESSNPFKGIQIGLCFARAVIKEFENRNFEYTGPYYMDL